MTSSTRLQRLLARCWYCFAFLIIAAAVAVTLLRMAVPWLEAYRDELASAVSAYIDAPVRIGGLAVEWQGLAPQLRLNEVRVGGEPGEALRFERADIDFGLGWSVPSGVPLQIDGVDLVGIDVRARLDRAGRLHWRTHTIPLPTGEAQPTPQPSMRAEPRSDGGLEWLLSVDQISLRDIRLRLDTPHGERILPDTDLRLVNEGPRHRLGIRATGWGGKNSQLRIAARLQEGGADAGRWPWRIHVATEHLDLAALGPFVRAVPLTPNRGLVDARVWLRGRGAVLDRALIDAAARALALRSRDTGAELQMQRLAGRALWQRKGNGWRLLADEVSVERGGRAWPATELRLEHSAPTQGPAQWRIRASFLEIADVAAMARLVELPEAIHERLRTYRPRGEIRGASAAWAADGSVLSWRARFDDLGWSASRKVPGMTGVDATSRGDADEAVVAVSTQAATLRMPRLFRESLPVAHAAGRVRLERKRGGLRLQSKRFDVANGDVAVSARFELRITEGEAPWIDLQADFGQGDLGAVSRYLPAKTMDPEAVEWLDRALKEGRVTHGTVLWRGAIPDFPYRDHAGHFSMEFRGKGGRVAFDPEWPSLTNLAGRVRFDGPAVTIEARRGSFLDGEIRALRVHFDDLDVPLMEVEARGPLPMADVIHLATQTPLREELGEAFRGAEGSGWVDSEVQLTIPLENVDAARVDGRFRLDGAALHQPRFGLDLTQIEGVGDFDDQGVSIEGMRARHAGQPVRIGAEPEQDPRPQVAFTLTGSLTPQELLPKGAQALAACCRGRSRWRVGAVVPTGDSAAERPVIVTARSDMEGTAVDIPVPFEKPSAGPRRLDVRMRVAPSGDSARTWFNFDGAIRGVFALLAGEEGVRVDRGTIRFGDRNPTLADQPGLHLAGHMRRLHVGAWIDWLGRRDGGEPAPGWRLMRADLTIDRVQWGRYEASDVDARARRQRDVIVLDLASSALAGRLEIPTLQASDRTYRGRFQRIDWALLQPDDETARTGDTDESDVAAVPPLDLRAKRLELRHGTLRDAALVTRPTASGQRIHRFGFDNPGLRLSGEGEWRPDGEGGRTRLNLKLEGSDYGSGLGAFGYDSFLDGGEGQVRARLAWPGPPWAPRLEVLTGNARLDLASGRLEQLDVGPARVLGLFSLDWAGFLRSGFSFDSITGRVEFVGGNAYMRGVTIAGGPGRIRIEGRTGLVARDYDQRVLFQPQLSGSLTVLGALSGGPATGLGVAVFQGVMQAFGFDIDRATELEYRLTGSWADPNVRLVSPEAAHSDPEGRPPRRGR